MKRPVLLVWLQLLVPLVVARAEDFLDRVDELLTFSMWEDRARVRFSGTLDLE